MESIKDNVSHMSDHSLNTDDFHRSAPPHTYSPHFSLRDTTIPNIDLRCAGFCGGSLRRPRQPVETARLTAPNDPPPAESQRSRGCRGVSDDNAVRGVRYARRRPPTTTDVCRAARCARPLLLHPHLLLLLPRRLRAWPLHSRQMSSNASAANLLPPGRVHLRIYSAPVWWC